MRHVRHATAAATLLLAACDVTPVDNAGTPAPTSPGARLRAGDPKICVDASVEDTLRGLIKPDAAATDRYDITFDATSLEAFDAAVHKASCSTNVKVVTTDGRTLADTSLSFAVKPASRDPDAFVVSTATGFLKRQLTETMQADDEAERQQQQEAAEQRALLAVIKPKWLVGRWISADQGDDACQLGPYLDFRPDHQVLGSSGRGTWQLEGEELAYGAATMNTNIITNADADSFAMLDQNGQTTFVRRCAKQAAPSPSPAASAQAPTIELPATFDVPR